MRIRWRGLELPNRIVCDRSTLTDTYGKFIAEPFERGFGVTVGNSLRRILLSSLEGSAVTRVKIQGVQHEISTIPGVVEDVTDIILNIKSLVVKNVSDSPRPLRIERHERGVVKAADIITDQDVEIAAPELPASATPSTWRTTLLDGVQAVEGLSGHRPAFVRPATVGATTPFLQASDSLGLTPVGASVESPDALQPGVDVLVRRTLAMVRPGAIVLLHSTPQTASALTALLTDLTSQGYTLLSLRGLFALAAGAGTAVGAGSPLLSAASVLG